VAAEIYNRTIAELGTMLRDRETTPTELTRMYLERLDGVARRYNAVVTITEERALREAAAAEAELAAGYDRGPLHGIPGARRICWRSRAIRRPGARRRTASRRSMRTPPSSASCATPGRCWSPSWGWSSLPAGWATSSRTPR